MGKASRDKGARFERYIANHLREELEVDSYRGAQMQAQRSNRLPDVVLPGFWLECKVHATQYQVRKAMEQAKEEAPGGVWPTAVTKVDRGDIYVTMTLDDWTELVRQWQLERR
jgi:hypothetical protein